MKIMTFRLCLLATIAALLSPLAEAQQLRIERHPSGLFRTQIAGVEKTGPGLPQGRGVENARMTLTQATLRIPARLGTLFGVEFKIVSLPAGQAVALHEVWHPPAPGLHDPKTGKDYREIYDDFLGTAGVNIVRAYSFDNDWETVPGDWTIEVWDGQRLILSETFTVYRP